MPKLRRSKNKEIEHAEKISAVEQEIRELLRKHYLRLSIALNKEGEKSPEELSTVLLKTAMGHIEWSDIELKLK